MKVAKKCKMAVPEHGRGLRLLQAVTSPANDHCTDRATSVLPKRQKLPGSSPSLAMRSPLRLDGAIIVNLGGCITS